MKKLLLITALILIPVLLIAAGVDMAPPIIVSEISQGAYTNGHSDATSEIPLYGYLEGIHIEATAGVTTDVDIVTIGAGPGIVLFGIDATTSTNAYYPVRLPVVTTAGVASGVLTGAVARIPIVGQHVKLMAYGAGSTNKNITVRLYLDN